MSFFSVKRRNFADDYTIAPPSERYMTKNAYPPILSFMSGELWLNFFREPFFFIGIGNIFCFLSLCRTGSKDWLISRVSFLLICFSCVSENWGSKWSVSFGFFFDSFFSQIEWRCPLQGQRFCFTWRFPSLRTSHFVWWLHWRCLFYFCTFFLDQMEHWIGSDFRGDPCLVVIWTVRDVCCVSYFYHFGWILDEPTYMHWLLVMPNIRWNWFLLYMHVYAFSWFCEIVL